MAPGQENVYLGRIKGISFSSREGVRPGGPAPKRDAGNTYGKAERSTTQTLRNPKEVKRGQPVFRGVGWETRGCVQMEQILLMEQILQMEQILL